MHPRAEIPSQAQIGSLIRSLLPTLETDVQFLYHVPRYRSYDATQTQATNVIVSVTPTAGVYSRLRPGTVCFLHRPFLLDRRRVPPGALILASHTAFDEVLTTGYNVPLAARLGMRLKDAVTIKGYKGNPGRRIGIVGRVANDFDGVSPLMKDTDLAKPHVRPRDDVQSVLHSDLCSKIQKEFDGPKEWFRGSEEDCWSHLVHERDDIGILAIMSAFDQEVVGRVNEVKRQMGWDGWSSWSTLYLTGQPREAGLKAADEHQ
ncbi:hypothetical protein LTS18_013710, partial [Coniosporium uncinatum]